MTNPVKSTKAELLEKNQKLLKLINLINSEMQILKQQTSHIKAIQNNYNGSFSIANYVEDEILIKSHQQNTNKIKIEKAKDPLFYLLLENAYFLISKKDWLLSIALDDNTITNENTQLGNGLGATYKIEISWLDIPDNKRKRLNYLYNESIPLVEKQNEKFANQDEQQELSQLYYQMTGKEIAF